MSAEGASLSVPLYPRQVSQSPLSLSVRSLSPPVPVRSLSPPLSPSGLSVSLCPPAGLSVPSTPVCQVSLSPPLLPVSFWDTRMYTHARVHTHSRLRLCVLLLAGIKSGLGSHVSGIMDQKGVVIVAAGAEPWEASSVRGQGCAHAQNSCESLQRPEPGLPSHLRDRGEGVDLQPLCAHVPLFLQDS